VCRFDRRTVGSRRTQNSDKAVENLIHSRRHRHAKVRIGVETPVRYDTSRDGRMFFPQFGARVDP